MDEQICYIEQLREVCFLKYSNRLVNLKFFNNFIDIGNIEIVAEMLKCGYRSLEAKNQEGQTAVHLACQLSQNDILEKLILCNANVNCRDSEGNTPLHVYNIVIF